MRLEKFESLTIGGVDSVILTAETDKGTPFSVILYMNTGVAAIDSFVKEHEELDNYMTRGAGISPMDVNITLTPEEGYTDDECLLLYKTTGDPEDLAEDLYITPATCVNVLINMIDMPFHGIPILPDDSVVVSDGNNWDILTCKLPTKTAAYVSPDMLNIVYEFTANDDDTRELGVTSIDGNGSSFITAIYNALATGKQITLHTSEDFTKDEQFRIDKVPLNKESIPSYNGNINSYGVCIRTQDDNVCGILSDTQLLQLFSAQAIMMQVSKEGE